MLEEYTAYENFNIKRFFERKNIPYHAGVKYQFSTINNKK